MAKHTAYCMPPRLQHLSLVTLAVGRQDVGSSDAGLMQLPKHLPEIADVPAPVVYNLLQPPPL